MLSRWVVGVSGWVGRSRRQIERYLVGGAPAEEQAPEQGAAPSSRWPRWTRYAIAAVALVFYVGLTYYAVRNWDVAALQSLRFAWAGVALAVGIHIPGRIWAFFLRQQTMARLGYGLPLLDHLRIVTFSDLASKLPGLFWAYISQIYLYSRGGVARSVVGVTIALEIFIIGVASCFTSVGLLLVQPSMQQYLPMPILLAALAACTCVTHPAMLRLILRRLPNPPLQEALGRLTWGAILALVAGQAAVLIVGGGCLFGIVGAVAGFSPGLLLTSLTIWSLTMVWGVLLSWLPVDFGLRQGPLLVMLTALYAPPVVVIIMIIWRIWYNCMEFGWGALAVVLTWRKSQQAAALEG